MRLVMAIRGRFHEGAIVGLASLVIVAALLAGCQTSVQVNQRAQPKQDPEAIAAPQPMEHNLSLLAVDFDPPLDQLELAMGQGVTLMAAIQNNGQDTERSIPIIARLYDMEKGGARSALLVESVTYLDEIGPGEISIARFDRLTSLPVRSRYFLTIEIARIPGEFALADNIQRFEIVVRPMSSAGSIRSE